MKKKSKNKKPTKQSKKLTSKKRSKDLFYNKDGSPKNGKAWVESIVSSVGNDAIYSTEIKW